MAVKLRKVEDTATKRIEDMINKGRSSRAFFAKYVRPAYQEAQRKRFATENTSEGPKWANLSPNYAKHKLEKFKGFPGGGRKINIATGRLVDALLLKNKEDAHELIFETSYVIKFGVPYAKYVNEVRPIVEFRKEFYDDLKKKCTQWMIGGKV